MLSYTDIVIEVTEVIVLSYTDIVIEITDGDYVVLH